jgi:hypothetical protein
MTISAVLCFVAFLGSLVTLWAWEKTVMADKGRFPMVCMFTSSVILAVVADKWSFYLYSSRIDHLQSLSYNTPMFGDTLCRCLAGVSLLASIVLALQFITIISLVLGRWVLPRLERWADM